MGTIRVLHLLHSMNRGGAETMLMNYYRNIDKRRVQFDFLLTYEGKSDYEDEILELGGRVFHIAPLSLKTIHCYCKDLKIFLQLHPEYRIIHSHTSSKSYFPLKVAKKCGVPVLVSHSHNMFLTEGFSVKEWIRKKLREPLKKVSTHNFACSKDAAVWLYGEEFWQQGKVRILPNAIEIEDFSYDPELREKYRKIYNLETSFVLGHVGRFMEQKNHIFLLEIFEKVVKKEPNAKLVLVGDGPLHDEIEEKAKSLGIYENVIFTGVRDDVAAMMQMMDVFVFPSLFEGLGIVLVEAQATGLPCLTSKDVVPEEVKMTELLEFVSLEEPEAWVEKILSCKGRERNVCIHDIKKAGYDIKDAAIKLQKFYENSLRK